MPPVRVRLLGPFEVEGFDPRRFGSRKARQLLALLATARGGTVSVDGAVAALWGDEVPARPAEQVAVLVSRLRAVLGAERITRGDAGYALRDAVFDVDSATALADEARRRLDAGSHASAAAAATAGLRLVRGPLLAEEPDAQWATQARTAAERLVASLRHLAAAAALGAGDLATAAEHALLALDADPYDETALRLAMAALARDGRVASALALYERLRERLVEDLGVDPSAETRAVHLAILKGEPFGPAATEQAPVGGGADDDLPGRGGEVAKLDDALDRMRRGAATMVVVSGEPGIGKTRLLQAFAARAAGSGARVLAGRCDDAGSPLPLQAVLDALDDHLRSRQPAELAGLLGDDGALLRPLLDRRLSVAEASPGPGELGPVEGTTGQVVLFAALFGVFARIAAESGAVLLIDDAHLADSSTTEWLAHARRRLAGSRLLVLAAIRTGEGAAIEGTETLELGPLDVQAATLLVGKDAAARLHERSGGNPLFLLELAQTQEGEDLPESLREALAARLARSGPAAETLRSAAVLHPEVDLELLAGVLQRPPTELLDHLEEGVRRRLLAEHGAGFAFRHALVREGLAAATGAARRAHLHREAARILAARARRDPLRVAWHARHGGDTEREVQALVEAARVAVERHAHEEAEDMLDRAVELHDAALTRLERARVRILRNRQVEAAADAETAAAAGGGAAALEVAGWAAYYHRDMERARRLADDALALAEDPLVRSSCLVLAGRIDHAQGRMATAEASLTAAADTAARGGLLLPSAWLALLRVHQGHPADALRMAEATVAAGAAPGHLFASLTNDMVLTYALASLGRPADALRAAARFAEDVERRGATRYAPRPDNFRGWVLRNLGEGAAADEFNQRALELARSIAYTEAQAHALLDLADGRLIAGDLDATARLLDAAEQLQHVEHGLRWRHLLRHRLLAARLALCRGDVGTAWRTGEELRLAAEATGGRKYVVLAALITARVRAAAGDGIDPQALQEHIDALDEVAGLEAWWVTAETAAALRVDRWWSHAEERAARLAAAAGDRRAGFERYAGARLQRMRTSSTSA
jgi:DNA-binding SARP family transcriptional activator